MDHNNLMECGGFYFIHHFDSGNLGHVERVPTELIAPAVNPKTNGTETPEYEFNLWTRPDCAGTEFENGNRTWFYFGVQASEPNTLVRLNLINLNKQGKMYNQGMAPVTRTLPGKPQWERIRDRPVHSTDDNAFTLSFKYRTSDNVKATTFFAFTYPFSFAELQIALNSIDMKMLPLPPPQSLDDIYYCRECLIYSLEGRRVDLLTITSHHGIMNDREDRLRNLFPENQERPFKFQNKKIIFISARVHPGETPSSFVFNGFLNLILNRNDPIAIQLRKQYVFKMIPFLNPDGVARGHYRTDTRGVNLNRVYLNPSLVYHPTVYASRALIRYYHFGCEKEDICDDSKSFTSRSIQNINESAELLDQKKKKSPNNATNLKSGEFKRDKAKCVASNKSSTAIKQPSNPDSSRKDAKQFSGETAHLAEQVYDMKLQEMPSQTSDISSNPSNTNVETPSLLNDDVLRSCLGSNVHLSTSDELNIQGSNPLRPLRDTLKNSISLLMESNSSVTGDNSITDKDSRQTNVRIGWCSDCRRAVNKLEDTMPGITTMVPGYSSMRLDPVTRNSSKIQNIEEYREHQKQQIDEQEQLNKTLMQEKDSGEKDDAVYFCTNCFKKYVITETNEEIVCSVVSTASVAVSAGDSGDYAHDVPRVLHVAPAPVASAPPSPPPQPSLQSSQKESEKPKPLQAKQPKKKGAPPAILPTSRPQYKEPESGLFLYIDLHGHASKKGIFMYGNHFEDVESSVECMLLPRIMSLNNLHFHFSSCNFTERNMYLKDRRDGMSREGSGRVAVLKATGLVRSYTLECNYNTGRLVNVLPPAARDAAASGTAAALAPPPPKYTPHIFEEVGRALGASILDVTGAHPDSRIPASEHRSLPALRDWLRHHSRTARPPTSSPTRAPLYARSKGKVTDERKENTYAGAKTDSERKRSPPVLAPRPSHDIINVNMKFAKKNDPVKTPARTRYLTENEPKPKTLSTKRRNILAIRKPNSTKTQVGGVVKAKISRRSADDADGPRPSLSSAKLAKRGFSRALRASAARPAGRCRAAASSSSEDVGGAWDDVAPAPAAALPDALSIGGKRRPFPNPSPSHLKKIRLKTAM